MVKHSPQLGNLDCEFSLLFRDLCKPLCDAGGKFGENSLDGLNLTLFQGRMGVVDDFISGVCSGVLFANQLRVQHFLVDAYGAMKV